MIFKKKCTQTDQFETFKSIARVHLVHWFGAIVCKWKRGEEAGGWAPLLASFWLLALPEHAVQRLFCSLLIFPGWLLILCGRRLLLLLFTFCWLVALFPPAGASGTAAISGVAWLLLFHCLYGRFLSFATPEKGEERNSGRQRLLDSPELLFSSPSGCPLP